MGKGMGPVAAYLDLDGIVSLAKDKGVDMIHPGFGFLCWTSEVRNKVHAVRFGYRRGVTTFDDAYRTSRGASRLVRDILKEDDELVRFNLKILHKELNALNVENTVLIAIGDMAMKYLRRYRREFGDKSLRLEQILHYSHTRCGYHDSVKYVARVKNEIAELGL